MPAGTTWTRYLLACSAAMLSMMAGSQTVHMIYQPLLDLDEKVELEKERLRKLMKQSMEESSPTTNAPS